MEEPLDMKGQARPYKKNGWMYIEEMCRQGSAFATRVWRSRLFY